MTLPAKTCKANSEKWLPLWMHLADTAGVMEYLVNKWLSQALAAYLSEQLGGVDLRAFCVFMGATHDVGKGTAAFVSNVAGNIDDLVPALEKLGFPVPGLSAFTDRSKSPHALAGDMILRKLGCPKGATAIVGAHHGKPQNTIVDEDIQLSPQGYGKNYNGGGSTEVWEKSWMELLQYAMALAGYESLDSIPKPSMPSQVIFTGLVIMADWIASNDVSFPLIPSDETGSLYMYPERVDRALDKLALPEPWNPKCFIMNEEMFHERFCFYPRPFQTAVLEMVNDVEKPGLMIMEAQMGVGKTEAALAAAEVLAARTGQGGIYFGLPTQATANGIFSRLLPWAEAQSGDAVHGIRLAHGMAALNKDYQALFESASGIQEDEPNGGLVVHPWFSGRKQALLADFVIGTVDQLLMAALKQKHVMLRHLGLAGKVVIIDECHAYDAYMNHYLERALTWLGAYKTPVIILSATLPAQRRMALTAAYLGVGEAEDYSDIGSNRSYPLLTWTDGGKVYQKAVEEEYDRREIQLQKLEDGEIAGVLRDRLTDGGCAGVIVNTVKKAQELTEILSRELPELEIFTLHAQFVATDRADRESLLMERLGKASTPSRRDRLVVVGTQVIEQSLDLDFDLMITDLCPMDLLLQRMGRLHRHDRRRPSKLAQAWCMVTGAGEGELDPGSKAVYDELMLLRTKAMLPGSVELPGDIPTLVQDVYDESVRCADEGEAYIKAKASFDLKRSRQETNADAYRVSPPVYSKRSGLNTIDGWLDAAVSANDTEAEAAVRDGVPSVEVLIMVQKADGIAFLPWQNGGAELPRGHVPSEEECRAVAAQRMRLPGLFSSPWLRSKAIAQLENDYSDNIPEWKQSKWLCDELILLLDENLEKSICGYVLSYDRDKGLSFAKEDVNGEN